MRIWSKGWLAAGLIVLGIAPDVRAAPQILGLIASAQPTELNCANGVCSAELSAFCLQHYRQAPAEGRAYRPGPGTRLTLVLRDRNGGTRRVAANDLVTLSSQRGFAAVRISLPESALGGVGASRPAIEVGPLAALVPVADTAEAAPLDADEVTLVTGPVRARAERGLDPDDARLAAAQATNLLVNTLPAGGESLAEADRLWRQLRARLPESGRALTQLQYQNCHFIAEIGDTLFNGNIRKCLASAHDDLMRRVTDDVWKHLDAGS